jgi:hypothetical protein
MSNQIARNSRSKYVNVKQQDYEIKVNASVGDATITQFIWDDVIPGTNPAFEKFITFDFANGTWECKKDGVVGVDYTIVWDGTAAANGTLRTFLTLNGGSLEIAPNSMRPVLNPFKSIQSGSYELKMIAGEKIVLKIFQSLSTPAPLNVMGKNSSPNRFCTIKITYSDGS